MAGLRKGRRTTRLSHMAISEISLCKSPASPGSNVAIFKGNILRGAAYERGLAMLEGNEAAQEVFEDAIDKADAAIAEQMPSGSCFPENYETDLSQGVYSLAKSLASYYDGAAGDETAQVQKQADEFVGWAAGYICKEKDTTVAENKTKTKADPEGTGKIKFPAHIDKGADAGKMMDDGTLVTKSDENAGGLNSDEFISKSDLATIIKSATAPLEAQIAKMQEDTIAKARLDVAKQLAKGVPNTTPEQVADVLKSLEGNEEALKSYKGTLALAKHSVAGMTSEIGQAGTPSNDPQTEISKMVDAVVSKAKEAGTPLNPADAALQVYEARPDLYAAARRQRLMGQQFGEE